MPNDVTFIFEDTTNQKALPLEELQALDFIEDLLEMLPPGVRAALLSEMVSLVAESTSTVTSQAAQPNFAVGVTVPRDAEAFWAPRATMAFEVDPSRLVPPARYDLKIKGRSGELVPVEEFEVVTINYKHDPVPGTKKP